MTTCLYVIMATLIEPIAVRMDPVSIWLILGSRPRLDHSAYRQNILHQTLQNRR